MMRGSRGFTLGVAAWLAFVHAFGASPVAHAHGENMRTMLMAVALLFHAATIAFLCLIPGQLGDKGRIIGVYLLAEVLGAGLVALAGDNQNLATIGGWVYATGLFAGPIIGGMWISEGRPKDS